MNRTIASLAVVAAVSLVPEAASAAPPWVDRTITLPRLVFAGNVGLGFGVAHTPPRDFFGPGLNLEGAIGVTDRIELGLRTGIRLTDDARATGADAYGRTFFHETYGTNADSVANPEFHIRWAAYSGNVVEVGLDGRAYLPIENGSRFGLMFGVPLAFHVGNSVRIDTGAYVPVVFYNHNFAALDVPGYFWFQISDRLWLGPLTALRFINPGGPGNVPGSHTDLLLGFGLGYQVANAIDLKTWILFPAINQDSGARNFGFGVGLEFRIGD